MRDVIPAPVPGLDLRREHGHHQSPGIRAVGLIFLTPPGSCQEPTVYGVSPAGLLRGSDNSHHLRYGACSSATSRISRCRVTRFPQTRSKSATSGLILSEPISAWASATLANS